MLCSSLVDDVPFTSITTADQYPMNSYGFGLFGYAGDLGGWRIATAFVKNATTRVLTV
jgi:hypothetical protein